MSPEASVAKPFGEFLSGPRRSIRTMADLIADPPPPTPTLLEPALIVKDGITVLAAPTKVGKTNLWTHMAWALTEGHTLFRHFTAPRPVNVLMLQLELSEATMYGRLMTLRDQLGWSPFGQDRFSLVCARALLLDRQDGMRRIVKAIEEAPERPEVVILDSYNAAVAGDPDKSSEARRALHALRTIQEQTGITWCLTAEIRKAPSNGRMRLNLDDLKGSNELAYDADSVLILGPDSTRRRLRMNFAAMRHLVGEAPEGLVLERRGLSFELAEGVGEEREEAVERVVREHLRGGGDSTFKACAQAVRDAGHAINNVALKDIRNRLLQGRSL